jgi:hypothetical protein
MREGIKGGYVYNPSSFLPFKRGEVFPSFLRACPTLDAGRD